MFDGFNFAILDDPDFKEDAVREELIVPILNRLGYTASGENRIVRSKPLVHPYVYLGTKKYKVNIIPDYILSVGGERKWVLDAKAPGQDIRTGKNTEQAFSYSIHKDIRVVNYALCNGRELAVFHISKIDPVLEVPLVEIDRRWDEVNRLLCPMAFIDPGRLDFFPDFGLTLKRLGGENFEDFWFPYLEIQFIIKAADDDYTVVSNFDLDGVYCASFNLSPPQYQLYLDAITVEHRAVTRQALSRQPYHFDYGNNRPHVTVNGRLHDQIIDTGRESFVPFVVKEIKCSNFKEAVEGFFKHFPPTSLE